MQYKFFFLYLFALQIWPASFFLCDIVLRRQEEGGPRQQSQPRRQVKSGRGGCGWRRPANAGGVTEAADGKHQPIAIKRKNPASPYHQNEVSDVGFPYTNQSCLAVEDIRYIPCLSAELWTWTLSIANVYAVAQAASQTVRIVRRRL